MEFPHGRRRVMVVFDPEDHLRRTRAEARAKMVARRKTERESRRIRARALFDSLVTFDPNRHIRPEEIISNVITNIREKNKIKVHETHPDFIKSVNFFCGIIREYAIHNIPNYYGGVTRAFFENSNEMWGEEFLPMIYQKEVYSLDFYKEIKEMLTRAVLNNLNKLCWESV